MNDRSLVIDHAVVRDGTTVLADVADLRLEPGRPLTIVGESGSGKSVLAHALMGTLPAELTVEGSARIGPDRYDLADRAGRRHLWGSSLALLPQEPAAALDPTMRVRSQVAEGARAAGGGRRDAWVRAERRLATMGLAGAATASYPHQISGGMAQRVAFAAATIGGAPVLVVDEPSKGLDHASLERLADLLLDHVAAGGLLLTITHDLGLARRLGGDLLVMRDAAVVEAGPVDRVLGEPGHAYTRSLLRAQPTHWAFPWMRSAAAPDLSVSPVVSARGISKAYDGRPLFNGLSLDVRPGERWALTGPSGAGKTTLGNAMVGITKVDRGSVVRHRDAGAGRVQKLYQDPALSFAPRVSLATSLRDAAQRHGVGERRVHGLVDQVGLSPDLLARRPDQVSGGELQRIALVRALLPRPVLIMADEATSRLDLVNQARTTDILMAEAAELDAAVVLITHDHDLADAVADHRLHLDARAG